MHHPLHLNLTKIWSVAIAILLSSPESALSEKPQPHDSIQVPHIQVTDGSRRSHSLRGAKQRRLDEVEASPSSDLQVIQPRVVGGNDAPSDSYPFAAAAIYAHKYYACGATLVASNVVLLAAHCASTTNGVLIGRKDLEYFDDDEEYFVLAEKLIHPEYNYLNPPKYDFVLARLNGYSTFKPARIDVGGHDLLDSKAEVTTLGWGKSTKGGTYATTLKMQEGQLNLMSSEDCRRSWWGGQITDEMICAYDEEVNTCVGDSGGPLVYYDEDDIDRENPTLVGVVSWGSGSCAYATVYANVAHEYKWILTNANAWSNGELCYNYRSSDDCDADDMCSWQEGKCHSSESQIS